MLSNATCTGVAAAIELVNADPALDLCFDPIERDPQGNIDAYGPLCNDLLQSGARHMIGCVTSWSRKEVIPELERHGGTLWGGRQHQSCPEHQGRGGLSGLADEAV